MLEITINLLDIIEDASNTFAISGITSALKFHFSKTVSSLSFIAQAMNSLN
jgi:hypothetical protein